MCLLRLQNKVWSFKLSKRYWKKKANSRGIQTQMASAIKASCHDEAVEPKQSRIPPPPIFIAVPSDAEQLITFLCSVHM